MLKDFFSQFTHHKFVVTLPITLTLAVGSFVLFNTAQDVGIVQTEDATKTELKEVTQKESVVPPKSDKKQEVDSQESTVSEEVLPEKEEKVESAPTAEAIENKVQAKKESVSPTPTKPSSSKTSNPSSTPKQSASPTPKQKSESTPKSTSPTYHEETTVFVEEEYQGETVTTVEVIEESYEEPTSPKSEPPKAVNYDGSYSYSDSKGQGTYTISGKTFNGRVTYPTSEGSIILVVKGTFNSSTWLSDGSFTYTYPNGNVFSGTFGSATFKVDKASKRVLEAPVSK